ncbi:MAG: hypothetical protein Q9174_003405 [Haloplaca sp. 1 TL-2023]
MSDIKTTPSPEATSAPAAILHPNPSQPPSPITSTPHSTRPPKRKLDTEGGQTCKRRQIESSFASVSTPVEPEEPHTPRQPLQDKQDQPSQPERGSSGRDEPLAQASKQYKVPQAQGHSQDRSRETQEITQDYEHSIRQDNRDHDSDSERHEREGEVQPPRSSSAPLSKANLRLLQQEVAGLEEMDNESTSSSQARKRRAPSRQTSNSDLVSATSGLTKESTPSQSVYRYKVLADADVYIRPEPPPETVQAQLDTIFERTVTDDKRREISNIAKQKSPHFSQLLRVACREDDLVELVHQLLLDMHVNGTLTHPRKADWNLDLKPTIQQQQDWDLKDYNLETPDSVIGHFGKPREIGRAFPSPATSHTTMPPPAAPRTATAAQYPVYQDGAVKTPRPDFTIGFSTSTITDALVERGLTESRVRTFLKTLHNEQRLYSDPTQSLLEVRFPILVIEGKAYATGKTLFEAENQAAVSGCSMLRVQEQLMSLTKRTADLDSTAERAKERSPLAFSVCTQGPILELWVHHLVTGGGTPGYHMNLIAVCHASLRDDLANFLLKMDQLFVWYKQDFLKDITDDLFAVASHAAR